ncbi:glycosyltransferase family 9 protein [Roseimicrobium sp. ORNL1]|uniref:glycosyltransferase family 9 protein n=1 Tax=Roseimicrobium sp. ORNL1 TaxID=2711231 RepID=UPI0013E13E61|nr:glycosyltransferase family 9 protein [Roseimicrobium sp. ORNL1]QIF05138.1 glycosyltransferase family 9 protein [Roseimicrobium sp. ORNL1]
MATAARPRVLVIRGGAIGDFILTLPAIRLLRESIPNAHIEVLGYKPIIELALAAGVADETRSLEHASMARLFAPKAPAEGQLADYFRSFNLIISYLYDPDGYFRENMERMGVKTFLACPHRVEVGKGHAAEQLAKPLESLAMYLEDPAPRIAVAEPPATHPLPDRPLVALHPGSGSLKKNLPVEHWIAAGRALSTAFPLVRLALITGEAEHERGITARLREGWQGLDYIHWDQLPLTTLAGHFCGTAAFLGHDSGISHLAAACGVPCLLFFGPTDPLTWAPRNAGVQVVSPPEGTLEDWPVDRALAEMRRFLQGLRLGTEK